MKMTVPSCVRGTYRRSIGISLFLFTIALTWFLWNHLATRLPDRPFRAFSFLLVIPVVGLHGLWVGIIATSEELRPKEPFDWGTREFNLIVLPLTLPVFPPLLLINYLNKSGGC